ncbi:hypothetical protein IW146_007227 [Coemansia sp. RSA 922]|nr:hypothetical protein GGI14_002986 [Coemansia sp. S680]KAJ2107614.1 hypothetical protein IW146_007227 [Coemansia sp. RSA 922]
MPEVVVNVHGRSYSMPRVVQACLTVVGVIVGAYFSAMGVYLMSASLPKFSYLAIPFLFIVTGILTVVASKAAMNGVLLDNNSFLRSLSALAWIVIVAEAWIVLATAIGKPKIEDDFRFAWSQIYNENRWQLTWIENRFGCCGFKSASDMPSSKRCADDTGRIDGCLGPLRQHVSHLDEMALVWTIVTLIIQVTVYSVGYIIYSLTNNGSTWLIEEVDEGLDIEPEPGQSTAPPPTTPAEMAGGSDDVIGTISGRQQHGGS